MSATIDKCIEMQIGWCFFVLFQFDRDSSGAQKFVFMPTTVCNINEQNGMLDVDYPDGK